MLSYCFLGRRRETLFKKNIQLQRSHHCRCTGGFTVNLLLGIHSTQKGKEKVGSRPTHTTVQRAWGPQSTSVGATAAYECVVPPACTRLSTLARRTPSGLRFHHGAPASPVGRRAVGPGTNSVAVSFLWGTSTFWNLAAFYQGILEGFCKWEVGFEHIKGNFYTGNMVKQ